MKERGIPATRFGWLAGWDFRGREGNEGESMDRRHAVRAKEKQG